jgi:hypothetical protein
MRSITHPRELWDLLVKAVGINDLHRYVLMLFRQKVPRSQVQILTSNETVRF